jgi:hypothetical protein
MTEAERLLLLLCADGLLNRLPPSQRLRLQNARDAVDAEAFAVHAQANRTKTHATSEQTTDISID